MNHECVLSDALSVSLVVSFLVGNGVFVLFTLLWQLDNANKFFIIKKPNSSNTETRVFSQKGLCYVLRL